MNKKKIFVGLNDIANIPMMYKKVFSEMGNKCDYYSWSDIGEHPFGYQRDKVFFRFKHPPPFRIFGKNPFLLISKVLTVIYLFYSILKYDYFLFISPKTFFLNNKDLKILKFFKKKVIVNFTGCVERDLNFGETDEDFICKRCQDKVLQKWCFCNDTDKKKELVNRLERHSDLILGQDDITSYVNDKSKLRWLFTISEKPRYDINLTEKYDQKELRIIHFPSNPLVKQSHIIVPALKKFIEKENVKIIIKDGVWERERIEEELSKAHILVNVLGTGYNVLAVEAMSNGCVVFNSHPEWFKRNVPDAPIVPITAKSLEETLEHFINNRTELKEYAERSAEYYYKYHSPEAGGNYYKKVLDL
jgi:hypothetical protein